MSFLDTRNAIGIGISSVITVVSSQSALEPVAAHLLCENENNLVQEDDGLLLLE